MRDGLLDRAAKLADIAGEPSLKVTWAATAEEIKADILEHGVDDRGVLRQHYATDALDASTLLAALFGFLPAEDERLRKSVLAIADDLTEDGFVLRYRTAETDDGLSGKEGSFLICSFWLVSALVEIGELGRARMLCERLLGYASPLLLYAEEIDPLTGRHLGNFPQAFTHLALINAVTHVIRAEQRQRARDLMERLLNVASPLGLYAEEFDADTGRHLGNFPQAFSHLALIEAAGRIIVAERLEELS